MMNKLLPKLLCFLLLLFALAAGAQSGPSALTAREQEAAVDSIAALLQRNYVFPEVAGKMGALISQNLKKGSYASVTDPRLFSERLTTDLQAVSKDKHIRVRFSPAYIRELRAQEGRSGGDAPPRAALERLRTANYGFREVKFLEGNIGYLDLRGFNDPKYAGATAVAAMNFLGGADALIIDLRKNGGGSPGMIQLISSYLFGAEPVHLNSFYFRPTNETTQTWTLPYVSGQRRPDMPVYVLTSKATFSAAEEFTYNLKNLKRATIIGETTGGGAHPGGEEIVNDYYTIFIPVGRAINPITQTNWEGTGVQPDVAVPATEALFVAQQKALETLAAKDSANKQSIYPWLLASLKARQAPLALSEAQLKEYAGLYGGKAITLEGGKLLFPVSRLRQANLLPLEKDLFEVEEGLARVRFTREGGRITGIRIERPDGNNEAYPKELRPM